MILVLEDEEDRIKFFKAQWPDCIVMKDPIQFFLFLEKNQDKIHQVFLDHDLEFFEYTPYKKEIKGMYVVDAMIARNVSKDIPIIVHSMNPSGGPMMFAALQANGFTNVRRILFYDLLAAHRKLE